MKIIFSILGRKWKSISVFTKNKEYIIRYWGGLKFDIVTISNIIK